MGGFPAEEVDSRVVNTSNLLGGRFSYIQDVNAGDTVGISKLCFVAVFFFPSNNFVHDLGYLQSSVGQGRRSSSAVAYLDPLVSSGSRPNLSVLINTVVTKLHRSGSPDETSDFRTVELGQAATS